jgi:hypothetical protein
MLPTMRRGVGVTVILAGLTVGGLAWLLLLRPPVSAPTTPSPSASQAQPETSAGDQVGTLPPVDPDPWESVEWRAGDNAFGEPDVLRRVEGLIDAGELLVGWGRVPWPGRNQFNDMGAVFVSADGVRWRQVAVDHGVNARSASTIGGLAAGPLGYLAVGSVCCDPEGPAMWHSLDALAWRRLDLQGDLRGYIGGVVAVENGWVAHGTSLDGSGEIWFSENAEDWEVVLHVEGGEPGGSLWDMDRTPVGLVAVGTLTAADGSYDGGVWSSLDGRSWERIGEGDPALVGDGEVQLHRVVGHAGGIFVTGIFGTAEQRQRCEEAAGMVAGIGPPPGPRPAGDATTCMTGTEHQWASADGERWQRTGPLPADPANPIEFRVVVAGGPGLMLLGESTLPPSPDTMLFTSSDGLSWTAVEPAGPFATEVAVGMVVRGRNIFAVTEAGGGASSFRSWTAVAP